MRVYQFALVTIWLALPAYAGVADMCILAHENGDSTSGRKYAKTLLDIRTPNLRRHIESGTKCLELSGYEEFAYDPDARKFTTDKVIVDRERRKRREIEIAREEEEQIALKIQRDELAKEKAAEEEKRAEIERIEKVQARLLLACDNLYDKSPDETILNNICYEYFLKNGLPE